MLRRIQITNPFLEAYIRRNDLKKKKENAVVFLSPTFHDTETFDV